MSKSKNKPTWPSWNSDGQTAKYIQHSKCPQHAKPQILTLISPQRDDMKLIKDTKLSLNGKCDVLWQSHDIVHIYLNHIYCLLKKRKHIIFAPLLGEEGCCSFFMTPYVMDIMFRDSPCWVLPWHPGDETAKELLGQGLGQTAAGHWGLVYDHSAVEQVCTGKKKKSIGKELKLRQ